MPAPPKFVKSLKRVKYVRNGVRVKLAVGDFVHVVSDTSVPFVAKILEIGETAKGTTFANMQWMYRGSDLRKRPEHAKRNEIYFSTHTDINPMESVIEPVKVQFTDEDGESYISTLYDDVEKTERTVPLYICRAEYDVDGHQVLGLSRERLSWLKGMASIPSTAGEEGADSVTNAITEKSASKAQNESARPQPPTSSVGISPPPPQEPKVAEGKGNLPQVHGTSEPPAFVKQTPSVDISILKGQKRQMVVETEDEEETEETESHSANRGSSSHKDGPKKKQKPLVLDEDDDTTEVSSAGSEQKSPYRSEPHSTSNTGGHEKERLVVAPVSDSTKQTTDPVKKAALERAKRLLADAKLETSAQVPKQEHSSTEERSQLAHATVGVMDSNNQITAAPEKPQFINESTAPPQHDAAESTTRVTSTASQVHSQFIPGRIRVGSEFQASVPAYLGTRPSHTTAKDEILWSPLEKAKLIPLRTLQDKIKMVGSVIPVVLPGPMANSTSDKRRVLWSRVAAPWDGKGSVQVLPVDAAWPHRSDAPNSFKLNDTKLMMNIHLNSIAEPENLLEERLVNGYRIAMNNKRNPKLSSLQNNDMRVPGLDDMYERWSLKEYEDFCVGVRHLKDRSQLSDVAKLIRTKTTAEVVEMYWAPRRGLGSVTPGSIRCSNCKSDTKPLLICKRFFDCQVAACAECFTSTLRTWSKLIPGDRDEDTKLSPFELARSSHWLCRMCNKKIASEEGGGKRGRRTPSPVPSADESSVAVAGSSRAISNQPVADVQHLPTNSIADVLLAYDKGAFKAEEALRRIRGLMLAEAEKAMLLKRGQTEAPT